MRTVIMKGKGKLNVNDTYEGESIETLVAKRMEGGEIELGGKALLYTERKDGVLPETNIRTDKFDLALMAQDAIAKSARARQNAPDKGAKAEGSQSESTQATDA